MTKLFLKTSCALFALTAASAAFAQTQGTAPSGASNSVEAATPPSAEGVAQVPIANSDGAIQEIVVTANKREENLQKVAGTVSAVSQAALVRQGVKELSDLVRVVPEVRVQQGSLSNVTIRGIRTGAYGPTTDSPNAVHIDGVYLARFTGLNGLFFDVQRVEVLAGPQGTLYGRNSAGGTINIISNKPTMDDAHAQGSLEYGNYNQFTINAAVNLPLSETLAVRAAYYHYSHNGYANNGTDDAELNSGRLSLLWKPSTSDSILLTADRQILGGRGQAGGALNPSTIATVYKNPTIGINATGGFAVVAAGTAGGVVVPIIPSNDPRDSRALGGGAETQRQDTRNQGYMAQYDHDFGWATLTAQGGYRKTYTNSPSGGTSSIQDPRLFTTGVVRTGGLGFGSNHSTTSSEELRLTSPSNQEFTYVLGLYHFREKADDNHSGGYLTNYPNTGAGTAASTVGQAFLSLPLIINMDISSILLVDNAYAAFGQVTYSPAFLEGLHVTGGLRYNYEKKHGIGDTILNRVSCGGCFFDRRASWKKLTYKANVAYEITPRNQIYFDNSTGFKSGGFAYGISPEYKPENITSYEIGSKNRFFDNKVQLNVSAWHYDYKNIVTTIQRPYINVQLPPPGIAFTITATNGEKAKVDGQSVSLITQVTPNDSVSFNGTHLNARYTRFDIHGQYQVSIAGGPLSYLTVGATDATYNYSNTKIAQTPNWAFSATYDHIFHVLGGELDVQGAAQYASMRFSGNLTSKADLNSYAAAQMPAYTLYDVSARYAPDGGRWSLTAYVRNITNKSVVLQSSYLSNNGLLAASDARVTYAYLSRSYGPPRTYGMIGSFNF